MTAFHVIDRRKEIPFGSGVALSAGQRVDYVCVPVVSHRFLFSLFLQR